VRDLGNVPGQRKTRQIGDEFLVHLAATELRRFARDENGAKRSCRIIFEKIFELFVDGVRFHVPDDDEGEIVRDVTRFVILHHLLLGELIVNFHLADYRQPVGMFLVSRREAAATPRPNREAA
jgi:putative hemolysin